MLFLCNLCFFPSLLVHNVPFFFSVLNIVCFANKFNHCLSTEKKGKDTDRVTLSLCLFEDKIDQFLQFQKPSWWFTLISFYKTEMYNCQLNSVKLDLRISVGGIHLITCFWELNLEKGDKLIIRITYLTSNVLFFSSLFLSNQVLRCVFKRVFQKMYC